ncbi:MAG: hypothetical protein KDA88_09920 [Planctomycetaceae bacterium]|nr:hypothetical protein [Planctomycetaceae bacterium]MCB9952727.1 hypothetical protein [Planctomycetaceae bacterium]
MTSALDIPVHGENAQEFFANCRRLRPLMSEELQAQVGHMITNLLARFGAEGMPQKVSGLTFTEMLELDKQLGEAEPAYEGEIDGVEFKLYDASPSDGIPESDVE